MGGKTDNREIGTIGEAAAAVFLTKKGMEILERNYGTKFGEIDLICRENDRIIFVEVKTKKGHNFGTPEEMFTHGKKRKVRRMATLYLKGEEVPCRIDMVAVDLDDENQVKEIRYYANAGET